MKYVCFLNGQVTKDDMLDDESNSITNQKLILKKFADENGFTNTAYYVDT